MSTQRTTRQAPGRPRAPRGAPVRRRPGTGAPRAARRRARASGRRRAAQPSSDAAPRLRNRGRARYVRYAGRSPGPSGGGGWSAAIAGYGGGRGRRACVIGVDVGGTKLLAGVVDEGSPSITARSAASQDSTPAALLDTLAAMVRRGARCRATSEIAGVGFGVPGVIDRRTGVVAASPHLPLGGVALPGADGRAPRPAGRRRQRRQLRDARRVAPRRGARRARRVHADDRHRHRRRHRRGGQLYAGPAAARRRARAHGRSISTARPARATAPATAASSGTPRATRSAARAGARAIEQPDSALGARAAAGREITGALVTELAHDGDERARAVLGQVGPPARARAGRGSSTSSTPR